MKPTKKDLKNKCVECTTKEQFIEVLKWHEKMGHRWNDGDKPMNGIGEWEEGIDCIDIFEEFGISGKSFQESEGLTILSFEEFKRDYCEPIYVHRYHENKDEKYEIIGECCMRNNATGKWNDAVMYKKMGEETTYVREKNDFEEEFEVLVYGKDG